MVVKAILSGPPGRRRGMVIGLVIGLAMLSSMPSRAQQDAAPDALVKTITQDVINTIRRYGSIAKAVEQGVLTSGIMHACVQHGIDFVLGGSVRDDGPLPDTVTDVVEAQRQMRSLLPGVGYALMVASMLHSIATGNLLPASVPLVCVDINPATVTKLADRGSAQATGVVTDVGLFLGALADELAPR